MINTNELMVGNYVAVDSHLPEMIVSIEVDKVFTLPLNPKKVNSRWQLKPKDIRGIPITKEWLIKFGFVKWAQKDNTWYIPNKHIEFLLDVVSAGNPTMVFLNNKPMLHIRTIHQLQNLYFALTGEQLKLKE